MSILRRRSFAALPSLPQILLGGPLWGLAMALSCLVGLFLRHGAETAHLPSVLLLFFCGGLIAWSPALFLGRFCALGRHRETRFAAFFLCLTVFTIAATALLFALDYRLFFARWHAPFGSRLWAYQFFFTLAGAVYQFLVMGVRLYLPLGFVALGLTSLWLADRTGDHRR